MGLGVSVELLTGDEPFLKIFRASEPLRVRAVIRVEEWIFTWGRGRSQWANALDENAAMRIQEAAR